MPGLLKKDAGIALSQVTQQSNKNCAFSRIQDDKNTG